MSDLEFIALSETDKVKVLSSSVFIAINADVFAILFLVEDFFVEAFYDSNQNLVMAVTFSSSAILPNRYLDLIILDDLLK